MSVETSAVRRAPASPRPRPASSPTGPVAVPESWCARLAAGLVSPAPGAEQQRPGAPRRVAVFSWPWPPGGRLFVRDWRALIGVAALFVLARQLAAPAPLPHQGAVVARLEAPVRGTTPTTWLQERYYQPGRSDALDFRRHCGARLLLLRFQTVGLGVWLHRRRQFGPYTDPGLHPFALGLCGYFALPTEPPGWGARRLRPAGTAVIVHVPGDTARGRHRRRRAGLAVLIPKLPAIRTRRRPCPACTPPSWPPWPCSSPGCIRPWGPSASYLLAMGAPWCTSASTTWWMSWPASPAPRGRLACRPPASSSWGARERLAGGRS